MAWSQTRSYAHSASGALDREDYFQEACLGLIRAAEKFDPAQGFRFSTYAVPWINQASRRARANLDRVIRLPVNVYDDARKVRATMEHEQALTGRTPSPADVGRLLSIPSDEVQRLIDVSQPVQSTHAEPRLLAQHELAAFSAPELLPQSVILNLLDALLTPRERLVVVLRFGLGDAREHTLGEIGTMLRLTRERVRQIQSIALARIRPLVEEALADN